MCQMWAKNGFGSLVPGGVNVASESWHRDRKCCLAMDRIGFLVALRDCSCGVETWRVHLTLTCLPSSKSPLCFSLRFLCTFSFFKSFSCFPPVSLKNLLIVLPFLPFALFSLPLFFPSGFHLFFSFSLSQWTLWRIDICQFTPNLIKGDWLVYGLFSWLVLDEDKLKPFVVTLLMASNSFSLTNRQSLQFTVWWNR